MACDAEELGSSAFQNCRKLTTLRLPKVKKIGILAFQGCTSLSSVELSDSLEVLEDFVFRGCVSLSEISLPVKQIGCSSFEGCKELKLVEMPHVKAVGDSAFEGCTALATWLGAQYLSSFGTCSNTFNSSSLKFIEAQLVFPECVAKGSRFKIWVWGRGRV